MIRRIPKDAGAKSAPQVEIEVTDVRRLNIALDTGHPLQFDLEDGDSYAIADGFSEIKVGQRTIRIATHRIVYYEEFPAQKKRVKGDGMIPVTPEQLMMELSRLQ